MITIKDYCCSRMVMFYDIPKVRVTYVIVCCLAWPCYSMQKMSNISTNSAPSGKLLSLRTIESSNVASTAIVEFVIDTSSNNDGVRGASSCFKKLDNSDLEFMMQEMRLNNCNGLAVISSLLIFSVGHCRNCCHIVIMSQLYPSEVVTSHFLHCYCSMMYSFVAIDGFICNNSSDM